MNVILVKNNALEIEIVRKRIEIHQIINTFKVFIEWGWWWDRIG